MNSDQKDFERHLAEAIAKRDAKRIGQLVDALRFFRQATYDDCYRLAAELTGISVEQ